MDKEKSIAYVTSPDTLEEKEFQFDHVFRPTHGFIDSYRDDESILKSDIKEQELMFETIGKDLLNSAFDGFDACLIAHGVTGTGKSYSMHGYG